MINAISINGKPVYGIYDYVCDTQEDLSFLPTGCAPGSLAYVIETGNIYVMNSLKKWVEFI